MTIRRLEPPLSVPSTGNYTLKQLRQKFGLKLSIFCKTVLLMYKYIKSPPQIIRIVNFMRYHLG